MKKATVLTLAFLMAWLGFMLLEAVADAEPSDQCTRALAMVDDLHGCEEHLAEMRELYAQVCAERPKRRECIEQRIEIRAYQAEVLELERETLAALRACNASRATRKASAP
jgi:hypothetical protein